MRISNSKSILEQTYPHFRKILKENLFAAEQALIAAHLYNPEPLFNLLQIVKEDLYRYETEIEQLQTFAQKLSL